MPTNGIADGILYSIRDAPIFTYGMISATALVLSYMTIMETPAPEIPEVAASTFSVPAFSPESPIETAETPSSFDTFEEPTASVTPPQVVPVAAAVPAEPLAQETEAPNVPPAAAQPQGGRRRKTRGKKQAQGKKQKRKTTKAH